MAGKALYVISTETCAGKTAVCAGLARWLEGTGRRVGYLKPLTVPLPGDDPAAGDDDALLMQRLLRLQVSPAELAPVWLDTALTRRLLRGEEPAAPLAVKEGLYRIGQEALRNAVRHARARTVRLRLATEGCEVALEVADDGVGFDPAAPRAPGLDGGFGLVGLRERVALLGGALQLDSAPDEGTRVRVTVPLQATSEERRATNNGL